MDIHNDVQEGRSWSTGFLVALVAVGGALAIGLGFLPANEPTPEVVTAGTDGEPGTDIVEALVAREAQQPEFLDEELANASLGALRANGMLDQISLDRGNLSAQNSARLAVATAAAAADDADADAAAGQEAEAQADVLMPLVHYINCAVDTCSTVAGWAGQQQLDVSDPVLSLGHGGIEEYHVEIYQVVPAAGRAIAAQADRVYRGIQSLNDETIRYGGWAPNTEVAQ